MTHDAFLKAQDLNDKLHVIFELKNILGNSTLAEDDEYYGAHNNHVINDDMILCYMCRSDDTIYKADTHVNNKHITGDFHMSGNFIYGREIPVELAKRLERTLYDYERELENEFKNLDGNYLE